MRTLVLGGIRSGKSRWAEDTITQALQSDQPVRYLAPGPSGEADPDWLQRIARHRSRRPGHWTTVETDDVAAELRRSPDVPALVDDLGTWLTRTLDRRGWQDGSATEPVAELAAAVGAFGSALLLVSPEVGLTVVPATASGRRFADELGTLNQRMAALCERVVLVVAGQALTIKAPA
ncbi:bifunctional adenosylcobinamide kinase/adenosylcobinamide-phosphate guanylyltransferase [Mycobacterium asiaticum]|uniref:bifunctional adenosylcobinamide kinase/adenosylcobinamide-phosphate guanylyltransferase n=1 Tax=Mycobacterium asiaticum TaxID=1790 RepID=UPI00055A13CC|nr:bifunctional adenosylcobinamide kinase/adenosylcobinamide-phosphate guanylyltransferase [Mycobacterium asiaticum]ORA09750.1 adenosylcobinamide kinase/adenosylcobinamide phosphate guanyltransferase [Mycobacterium asiaticum DSM 44297]